MSKLEDLGCSEATLFDITLQGNSLSFCMRDLISYDNPVKFEIVNVRVSDIEALRIELRPFINGKKANHINTRALYVFKVLFRIFGEVNFLRITRLEPIRKNYSFRKWRWLA